MRRLMVGVGTLGMVIGSMPAVVGGALVAPTPLAGAANSYGPGVGPQTAHLHWGGGYVLQNVAGLGFCIEPGDADPVELPDDQWSPVAYPGSAVFTGGEMASLAFFADLYDGSGYPGYSVDETAAAVAEIAYTSAGGVTPAASAATPTLVGDAESWMERYPGPWQVSVALEPVAGGVYTVGTTYSGTVTVTSASGVSVPGVQLAAPQLGGPAVGELSTFTWLAASTNTSGQLGFDWSISGVPSDGRFSATVAGLYGGPGDLPPTYGPPPGSGGQNMLVAGASEPLETTFGGTVKNPPPPGTISISKSVPDAPYYSAAGAEFEIVDATGSVVDTLDTAATGSSPESSELPASPTGVPYTVREVHAPPGYGLATPMVVDVYPAQNTVADFSGADEEPVIAAQLGVEKVDADTGQPLSGATFAFAFDATDDGSYHEELGTCTTGTDGICQPPTHNAAGGWLPGWYQITETAAPPGYFLDPATAVQNVYLQPGASATVTTTFADELLGSLQLIKTGNDGAYLPVAGAVFSVTGPAPLGTLAGTLTVGPSGTTNVLTGLAPGTYTVTETTPPAGYSPVTPFDVVVAPGPSVTITSAADLARPGSIVITKEDASTHQPLAGARFDTYYAPAGNGVFDDYIGDCVTGPAGTCSPPPDDATGFLPGSYKVVETTPPPGYATSEHSEVITVPAAGVATFAFADARLVAATFDKVATGNVNPAELDLAGAVIVVTPETDPSSKPVATCTTDSTGQCTTGTTLVSGGSYCWEETSAPPGLAAGASGCFTATNAQADEPITVVDPGMFVPIRAKKVDATDPSVLLAGATFDLFRVDGPTPGPAPSQPTQPVLMMADAGTPGAQAPGTAPSEPGQTLVAQATTGQSGYATFPLQMPGYAYCTLEISAPADYLPDTTEQCTGVLQGTTAQPPPVTTITTPDKEAMVRVSAHKFNAAVPDLGIPGAVYSLYVEGQGPPSGPPSSPPPGTTPEPGDVWWAEGTTSTAGALSFEVPAGYAWCFLEVSAPPDYLLDPGLHCTGVITTTTPAPELTVALPEVLADVTIYTHKYNALDPDTTIPGATYELVGEGALPPGWSPSPNPDGYPVPAGDFYVGAATTGAGGLASWTVPAGYAWCLHEVGAPPDYQLDAGWHCTGVLTADATAPQETVALPEVPSAEPAQLAFTGGPPLWMLGAGGGLFGLGLLLLLGGRRHPGSRTRGRRSSA